jgi:hypothetical protein
LGEVGQPLCADAAVLPATNIMSTVQQKIKAIFLKAVRLKAGRVVAGIGNPFMGNSLFIRSSTKRFVVMAPHSVAAEFSA